MKKIIISIMATVCIMAIGCAGVIKVVTDKYEAKIEEARHSGDYFDEFMINEYNELIDKYDIVSEQLSDLESNIWNMQNGKAYELTVDHNGETHTWKSDNKTFLSKVTHSVSDVQMVTED